ncbi:MAG: presenilin family intramembrane aspartyl protease [Candidatus Diapherotrites archaeon]|nr:presenilin family intramembrane aspartyl protease [Candidatus Diapherotrites archaeon]MDZ4256740.1 presenilin family intramembrane aspartyl protease [archaeon]
MDKPLLAQLAIYFIVVQALGLYVGYSLIQADLEPVIFSPDPDDPVNSVGLLAYILVGTLFILLAIKFLPDRLLYWVFKGIESLALFFTGFIVLQAFIPEEAALLGAVGLIMIRVFLPHILVWRNISSMVATIGAGAVIGISIGVWPVIIFLIALGIYDYIAVFKTKHMVTMAKAVAKKNLSFTIAMPTKDHQFELGTGDFVMPLIFGVSVLGDSLSKGIPWPGAAIPSIAILLASLAGLAITLDYGSGRIGKALPALPLQVALMVIMYGLLVAGGVV